MKTSTDYRPLELCASRGPQRLNKNANFQLYSTGLPTWVMREADDAAAPNAAIGCAIGQQIPVGLAKPRDFLHVFCHAAWIARASPMVSFLRERE